MNSNNVKQKDDKKLNTTKEDKETTDEKVPRLRKSSLKVKENEKNVNPNREDKTRERIAKEKKDAKQTEEKRRTEEKKERGKISKAVRETNPKTTPNNQNKSTSSILPKKMSSEETESKSQMRKPTKNISSKVGTFSKDLGWVNRSCVNDQAVKNRVQDLLSSRLIHADQQVEWLARSIQCIDLTTLAGDDCPSNVARLCSKAAHPLSDDLTKALQIKHGLLTTGAVCVYPARVADACLGLERLGANIPVASVATGFPTGQTSLKIRLEEIEFAVANGAKEIDIVINRELALSQNWGELYNELVEMRKACGESHMKSILAVGELCNLTNIYKASLVAMMAGSDFIKTSTGKETVNATLPIGLVMCRAIRAYNRKTGFKVGFKPAGGIRTSKDVLQWMTLMKEELGDDYLTPDLFRIGASALLNDIERNLANHATGGYFLAEKMPMA
uniref:Deoxyribose-phosphate aldolase n=1 Tax=Daphnia similis TaxID=35528 RepID=A0A4Y7N3P8_9CRUS|nr:EOG090X08W6 [Daphnia similis]SVE86850.1 EOG090X08W6 [Daphnia similis]SVE87476.1 EOG090X08W6 [Daphnia similis]